MIEEEFPETFTLTQPAERIDIKSLPQAAKKAILVAESCGWQVRAWLVVGDYAPTRYMSSNEERGYVVGDIKSDGYAARTYVVEARDPDMPLGFKATYMGKVYADKRKTPAGSFASASVVDPIGIPRELSAVYRPIPYRRGKYETEESFQHNVDLAQGVAKEQAAYNDGLILFSNQHIFKQAREFDTWLAEWRSFSPVTLQKTKNNA